MGQLVRVDIGHALPATSALAGYIDQQSALPVPI